MSVTPADLRPLLADWDGRFTAQPQAVYDKFCKDDGFVGALILHCADPACADAASWCLKKWSDNGGEVAGLLDLIASACATPGWACKLHTLQILPHQTAVVDEQSLSDLVQQACGSDRPMLRAWGYFGADIMARRFPDRRIEVAALLSQARAQETAGSIKARLKRCRL